jgi:hypothetical protein
LLDEEIREKPRRPIPEEPVAQRVRDFREVELSFTPEEAQDEAARCLRCDALAQEAEPALEPYEAAHRAAI